MYFNFLYSFYFYASSFPVHAHVHMGTGVHTSCECVFLCVKFVLLLSVPGSLLSWPLQVSEPAGLPPSASGCSSLGLS